VFLLLVAVVVYGVYREAVGGAAPGGRRAPFPDVVSSLLGGGSPFLARGVLSSPLDSPPSSYSASGAHPSASPPHVRDTAYPYGASEAIGRRPYMEDRHIAAGRLGGSPSASVWGVFDGHGGSAAADYCVARVVPHLVASHAFPSRPHDALREAFLETDREFIDHAGRASPPLDDGTCALAAVCVGRSVYVANAGDSRAVLIHRPRAAAAAPQAAGGAASLPSSMAAPPSATTLVHIGPRGGGGGGMGAAARDGPASVAVTALSDDHKPSRPDELRRIKEKGGSVAHHGVWRVEGILAVSR
jgi:protein phosphatase 1L